MSKLSPSEKKQGLTNRKRISSTVDLKLYEELDTLHKKTSVPKSKLMDQAILLLLKQYDRKKGGSNHE